MQIKKLVNTLCKLWVIQLPKNKMLTYCWPWIIRLSTNFHIKPGCFIYYQSLISLAKLEGVRTDDTLIACVIQGPHFWIFQLPDNEISSNPKISNKTYLQIFFFFNRKPANLAKKLNTHTNCTLSLFECLIPSMYFTVWKNIQWDAKLYKVLNLKRYF